MISYLVSGVVDSTSNLWKAKNIDSALKEGGGNILQRKVIQKTQAPFTRAVIKGQSYRFSASGSSMHRPSEDLRRRMGDPICKGGRPPDHQRSTSHPWVEASQTGLLIKDANCQTRVYCTSCCGRVYRYCELWI